MKKALISFVALVLLSGCTSHYLYREASLDSLPEVDCILASMKGLKEVESVQMFQRKTGQRATLTGLEEPGDVYDIRYSGDFVDAQILIIDEVYKGARHIKLRHELGGYHEVLNQSEADKEREIMLRVERSIAEHCNVIELLDSLEHCSGITCDKI
ncbi:hypothetical protein [Vibrio sp. WXL103]|uniref:hypothetical protein n=1 Tax=Vibrio sp. WXL103 TaxID=3450710 RepID=UPI003EC5DD27